MSDKLDMALGDIISTEVKQKRAQKKSERSNNNNDKSDRAPRNNNNRKERNGGGRDNDDSRRGRGGPARGGRRGRRDGAPYDADSEPRWARDKHPGQKKISTQGDEGAKIKISNLDSSLNVADLTQIFAEAGEINRVQMVYNGQGKPTGMAEITFHTRKDAINAVREFDGAEVDGRPMSVRVERIQRAVVAPRDRDDRRQPRERHDSNRGGDRSNNTNNRRERGGDRREREKGGEKRERGGDRPARGGRGGARGGRGGARGGRQQRESRPAPTASQLDDEMNDYFKKAPKTDTNTGSDE